MRDDNIAVLNLRGMRKLLEENLSGFSDIFVDRSIEMAKEEVSARAEAAGGQPLYHVNECADGSESWRSAW